MLLPSVRKSRPKILLPHKLNLENLSPKGAKTCLPKIERSFQRGMQRISKASNLEALRTPDPRHSKSPILKISDTKSYKELDKIKSILKEKTDVRVRRNLLIKSLETKYGVVFDKVSKLKLNEEELVKEAVNYYQRLINEKSASTIQRF